MTVQDGISARVSEHLESDRIVSTRPENHPFVRVTHFPWKDTAIDYDRLDDEDDDSETIGLPQIPLAEAYEVTIWADQGSIEETFVADCGVECACRRALAVAAGRDIPIWNTIRRLRPEHVVVADTVFETVPGDEELLLKGVASSDSAPESIDGSFVAVHRETGVSSGDRPVRRPVKNSRGMSNAIDRRRNAVSAAER